ncbi:glycoside hydrolase [Streptomyces olivoreticuli]
MDVPRHRADRHRPVRPGPARRHRRQEGGLPRRPVRLLRQRPGRQDLFETALHDSLVNTERWELSYDKLPQQKTTRALLAMLCNTPLNFVLDGASLKQRGSELAALQKYFAPLHEAAGTRPMTDFRTLTADRNVQRTVFGGGTLTVTANFGTSAYEGLPGGCADAKVKGDKTPRRLCPGDVNVNR